MFKYTKEGESAPLRSAPKPAKVVTLAELGELSELEYKVVRDRAAYVHVTGCHPSHLRQATQEFMSSITGRMTGRLPDPKAGPITIKPEVVEILDLENHPMVRKADEFFRRGFKVIVEGEGVRRKYSAVRMRGLIDGKPVRLTVQSDGSVLDRWA